MGLILLKKTEKVEGELTIRMAPGGGFVVKI